MAEKTSNKGSIILICIAVFIWFIFSLIIGFTNGAQTGSWTFTIGIIIFLIIGLLIFATLWLFQVKRTDMIEEMRKSIIKTCNLNIPEYQQKVYTWPDLESLTPSRCIGISQGYCQLTTKGRYEEIKSKQADGTYEVKKKKIANPKKVFVIAFNKGLGFPMNFFDHKKLFIGFKDDIRGTVDDENIYINGVLAPEIHGFITVAKHWERTEVLDETASSTVFRYEMQHLLSDIKNLVDDSIAISPEHKKRMEKSNLEVVSGGEEKREAK